MPTLCRPWLTPYWLPVIQISLTGSVWTTIAVSVERYTTVREREFMNVVFSLYIEIERIFSLTVNITF